MSFRSSGCCRTVAKIVSGDSTDKSRTERIRAAGQFTCLAAFEFARHCSIYRSVRPLQAGCSHVQSMSGVFSIASHWVLQYFPEVTIQEQIGCAHFLPSFAILISFLAAYAWWFNGALSVGMVRALFHT